MSIRKCTLAFALFACGCAAQKAQPQAQVQAFPHYEAGSSGSLVFDPPVTIGQQPLQLSRDDRQPAAFAGYDSSIATYFYVRTDDRQTSDRSDRFERRAISEKVGVNYR
ncbi:MAG TPA: hypothetical protein VKK61_09080 [Tepidisphaeraceae bacterium]|nr:hypothetical protein [Tepidisphaeraceae bacterium]